MFKGLKKKVLSTIISLAFILTLVPAIPVAANGGAPTSYIALGDSVSYGMSAVIPAPPYYKYGYTNMLYDYLNNNTFPYLTYGFGQPDGFNLSVPGAVSSDLLNVISNNESRIHDTNLISINIGGNNLLKPFTRALFSLYGLVGTYNDGTLTTEQKFATLAAAISSDPDPETTMGKSDRSHVVL